ncbi:hypothetical protein [Leptolyngbya sp. FACHB-261]|uniref:EamA family transporter n=1 Tax=Leptolyngbya sp. FACHB-261 TaxID=2692806 RepID=UPI0019AEF4C7|nr:hypothetical protein [Leptolyngbya sp. FACHB-261]MBD2103944.1 hypothetical protein [Leptolyngbya sp. FACHB-261]
MLASVIYKNDSLFLTLSNLNLKGVTLPIKLFSELEPRQSRFLFGVAAILLVMAIYTTNFVAIRYSILNGLTSLDLAALRFSVAGLAMLPSFCRLGLRDLGGLGWPRAMLLTCLAGSPYMVVFFFGLSFAPASHGAVLNPWHCAISRFSGNGGFGTAIILTQKSNFIDIYYSWGCFCDSLFVFFARFSLIWRSPITEYRHQLGSIYVIN